MTKINLYKINIAVFLLTPLTGYCEDYLFATDIVPVGKVDVLLGVTHAEYKNKFETSFAGLPVAIKNRQQNATEMAMLRFGLADNTHIGISGVNNHYEISSKSTAASAFLVDSKSKSSQADNPELFIKHRFYNEEESPLSLTAAASLQVNAGDNHYTGLGVNLTAGWRFSELTRAYAITDATFADTNQVLDTQKLELGVFQKISPRITLVPNFAHTHFDSNNGNSAVKTQSVGVRALVQVFSSTYLIPEIQYFNVSDFTAKNGAKASASFDEKAYSVSLYHYF